MSLIASHNGSIYVDLIGSTDDARYLQNANVYFVDADSGVAVEVDAITLSVVDAAETEQYLLSTVTTPAIELDDPGTVYTVDAIDVSDFPDGDITLNWTGTLDGYDYTATQTIAYNTAPDMVFVSGMTDTLADYKCVLGQAKTFSIRVVDALSNPITTNAVRGVIYDRKNASTETVSASLVSAGSGVWTFTHTLSSGSYAADLERYELYWEIQLSESGSYSEIRNSRVPLEVYSPLSEVTTGGLTYSTNSAIRQSVPDIDTLLAEINSNQAEREMILNRARWEASVVITEQVRSSKRNLRRDILELWEIYEVYRDILTKAHGFSRNDRQLEAMDKKISRLKCTLFAPISTIRVGRRA